jgi:hypothetical protein
MHKIISLSLLALFFLQNSFSQKRITPEKYIETYKATAIAEMKRSGVPASITLAQGMHESENGNSYLAVEGNNHFGIKCHNWVGEKLFKDDDQKNECFRKYNNASDSYRDHSDFLVNGSRYNFLFDYKVTDYKSWANGLKKAGYATNPKYPTLIIKLIEDFNLNALDEGGDWVKPKKKDTKPAESEFAVKAIGRTILKRNDLEYIVVKKGDNIDDLAEELSMFKWEIRRYNELTRDSVIREGQTIYLQSKRRKAEEGSEMHNVIPGESVYSISQLYGVKSRMLRKYNGLKKGEEVQGGDILFLRGKKPKK